MSFLLMCLVGQMAANMVHNPAFSAGLFDPDGWQLNVPAGNRAEWVCDRAGQQTFALRLVGSGRDWAGATSRSVEVKPGDRLTVAAWLRSNGADPQVDNVYVRFYGGGVFRGQEGPGVPARAANWTLVKAVVTVPAGADRADFSLQVRSRGTVLLGSAGLFRGDVSARPPLPRPGRLDPAPVDWKRMRAADQNDNGIADALDTWLGIPRSAKSIRRTRRPTTSLQTPTRYASDNDLKVDTILLVNESAAAHRSWQAMGYSTPFMAGFRAGQDYVDLHPGSAQTDARGRLLDCGPGSYYMTPTPDRRAVMRELFRTAAANGAQGAAPEEPEYIGSGGYSAAFKAEFQEHYGRPWVDPATSVQARVDVQRLMGHLQVELLRACYEGAAEAKAGTPNWLLCHSPVNYSAWSIMFPHHEAVTSLKLSDTISQVWTGTAQSAVNHQGIRRSRTFENAMLEYSSSLNLVRGMGIRTWLLMDPVEDAPGRPMADYFFNYKRTLGAALMFPETDLYEVMPWPTRIFGTVPDAFATTICTVINALSDMQFQKQVRHDRGTVGIATFISDSAMWQRQPPAASDFDSFYGLCLPLLMRGVQPEVAHLERASEPGYLDAYKVLLVSFDAMKPLEKSDVDGIAAWTHAGGRLLVFGGDDAYNDLDMWWKKEGFASPHAYLLHALGLTGDRAVSFRVSGPAAAPADYTVAAETPYTGRALENRGTVSIDLTRAVARTGAAYIKLEDTVPGDGWGPYIAGFHIVGTRDGKPLDQEVVPGTPLEGSLVQSDTGSGLNGSVRFVDATNVLVYRVDVDPGTRAEARFDLGNQYRVSVAEAPAQRTRVFSAVAGSALGAEVPAEAFTGAGRVLGYAGPGVAPAVSGPDGAVLGEARVGRGVALLCGLPPAHFCKTPAADAMLRGLVRHACAALPGLEYREQGHIGITRGVYTVVKTFDGTADIPEAAIDLMTGDLDIRPPGPLGPDDLAILKAIPAYTGGAPVLAAASDCVEWQARQAGELRLLASNALGVQGVLRVVTGGKRVTAECRDSAGKPRPVTVESQGNTALVRYACDPAGLGLCIKFAP